MKKMKKTKNKIEYFFIATTAGVATLRDGKGVCVKFRKKDLKNKDDLFYVINRTARLFNEVPSNEE